MRLLLVDDDAGFRQLLRTTFEDVQVEVDEAGSAAEAESRISALRPDVIVLDVGMPGMDGLAFCRELKSSEDTREISVVLLTGMDDVEDVAGAAGADALLLKPFRPLELLGVVDEDDLWQCAQLRPGDEVRFTRSRRAPGDARR